MDERYRTLATKVRAHCLRMTHLGNCGHIGSMLSAADIMAVLYEGILNVDPKDPKNPDRDRFLLSKGHAGAVVYAALCEKGFFPYEWLNTYYQDGGKLMGHISHFVPGVEFSTGSLGHGLPVAVGMALAAKERGKTYKIVCLMSDGDCNEGSTWEAIMFAGQHHLDNLTAIVDYNRIQALGFSKDIIDFGDFSSRIEPFGWASKRIDGHNYSQIEEALTNLPVAAEKPSLILANTIKGKGVSFLENTVASHYHAVTEEELERAYKELGVQA
ncbi:MAG: transketolase [Clostridia bacterium]